LAPVTGGQRRKRWRRRGLTRTPMDVGSVANTVVQQSTTAISVAAGALATQAHAIGQLANSKDPIAWLAGEEEDVEVPEERLDPPVAVPLAALEPWGAGWGCEAPPPAFLEPAVPPLPVAAPPPEATATPEAPTRRPPPFAPDCALNARVCLWEGDVCSLDVDALVAPSAAGYTCGASTVFPRVLRHGGKELRAELRHAEACRSGEARIAKAYGLCCRWLLLTVGPKYKEKYQVAAENTLNSCYRECFQLLAEADLRSMAIPCHWYAKGYPPEEQAHVALRTVRRCLERLSHAVDMVVIVAASSQEAELYDSLMPLYFPRTAREAEGAAGVLPESAWSRWGEVSVEERRIRISGLVTTPFEDGEDNDRGSDDSALGPLFSPSADGAADRAFFDTHEDADERALRRLEGTMIEAEDTDVARQACLRYLRRARDMHTEPEASRFVYRAGEDHMKRRIVVLLGMRLPSLGLRDERTLTLFVKELESLGGEHFVLLYAHSGVPALDSSTLEVLQEMLAVISARYRSSLDQLIVLHPGLWFRAAFAIGRAVSDHAAHVWNETMYVDSLADLSRYLDVAQLKLPAYLRAHDPSSSPAVG